MQSEKIFHPIGQGGFFSELIRTNNENIFIVFDCGSHNGDALRKEIKRIGHNKIDHLVISHLHADHINGLDNLVDGKEVINVYLPKPNGLDIIIAKFQKNGHKLTSNPKKFLKCQKVFFIGDTEENQPQKNIPTTTVTSHSTNHTICTINSVEWILRFYVKVSKYDKLSEDDIKLIEKIEERKRITKEDIKDAEKIYKKISSRINPSTMTMYSGPQSNDAYHRVGTLLTGDIRLDNEDDIKKIVSHYKNQQNNILDFSAPHHGGKDDLLRPIREFSYERLHIQYGEDNTYGHPSVDITTMHDYLPYEINHITEKTRAAILTFD